MPNVVYDNMISNSRITEDDDGLVVVENVLVENLSPVARAPLFDALQVTPVIGTLHPTIPDVMVKSRIPRPYLDSKTQAIVELTWRAKDSGQLTPTDAPRVRFSAYTRELPTSKDRDGKTIRVYYKPSVTGGTAPTKSRVARITDYKAMGTLEFDFVKGSDPSYLLNYFGRINNFAWRGGAKYTWHFADLSIDKQMYNPYWNVHAAFVYDPDTYVKTAFFTDKDGNIPFDVESPVDVTNFDNLPGTRGGWRNFLTQQEANFTTLGLPTGF
jgi:hypothetical protein